MDPDVLPVDAELFASVDPPRLAGSRCLDCRTVVFPSARSCPSCSSADLEDVELPDRGTVWTYTVQSFQPKPPYVPPAGGFRPYAVGYVDLGDVLVESLLVGDTSTLAIGSPVRLTLAPAWQEGDSTVVTFAFKPEESA